MYSISVCWTLYTVHCTRNTCNFLFVCSILYILKFFFDYKRKCPISRLVLVTLNHSYIFLYLKSLEPVVDIDHYNVMKNFCRKITTLIWNIPCSKFSANLSCNFSSFLTICPHFRLAVTAFALLLLYCLISCYFPSGSIRSLIWDEEKQILLSCSADKSIFIWEIGEGKGNAIQLNSHRYFALHSGYRQICASFWVLTCNGTVIDR